MTSETSEKQKGQDDIIMAQTRSRKTLKIVFLSLILDLLAFTVILPLFPAILEKYKAEDQGGLYHKLQDHILGFKELLHVPDRFDSVLFGGFLGSLFCILQFLASPVIGSLSDVYGRRPLLLLTTLGILGSYILWALSSSFALFVIARVIGGLSKGNISLSTAIVSDISSDENRGKGMAMIGVAFSVGFILGPLIGAIFSKTGDGQNFLLPAVFSIVLTVMNLSLLFFSFPETLPLASRRHTSILSSVGDAIDLISPSSLFGFSTVKDLPAEDSANLISLGRGYFWYLFIYSGLEFSLTFLVHLRFGFTSMDQGKMYCVMGLTMALLQGGYVRRLAPGTEKKHALRAALVMVPAFFVIALANTVWLLYAGLMLFSYGSAVIVPCITTVVSRTGRPDQKGVIMGTFRSLGALARGLGPFVACTCYWCLGPALCYGLGGLAIMFPYQLLRSVRQ